MTAMCDPAAERGVLAGVFTGGSEVYADIADITTARTFRIDSNQMIWSCLDYLFKETETTTVDIPSVLSAAKALGISSFFEKHEELTHLRAVSNMPVLATNVRRMAGKIRKLEIARLLNEQLDQAKENISGISGDEPIDRILGMAEAPIFDLTSLLTGQASEGTELMGSGAREYMLHLMDHPREMIGLSTGLSMYDFSIGGGIRPNSLDIIAARPKTGKAQSLDSIVQTPGGPVRMGDIKIGDIVCTPTGTAQVSAIYPQGEKEIYRVTFADGDSTECCLDHLWEVRHRRKKRTEVKTLRQLLDEGTHEADGHPKWSIRLPVYCYRNFQDVPMSPYLLGVILGDGGVTGKSVCLTSADEELVEYASVVLEDGYSFRKLNRSITYLLSRGKKGGQKNRYIEILRDLGVMSKSAHEKSIPKIYLNNSWSVRAGLLQGLLDTDGCVDMRGNCEYSTVSYQLAKDVKDLVQSLGGLCKIVGRVTTCDAKFFTSYRLHIRFNDLSPCIHLSRKRNRCKVRIKPSFRRRIVSIDYVGVKPAQCISIASTDGLYLTDHYIVTHNTWLVDHVGVHAADVLQIPVLNIDTEMSKQEHQNRIIAKLADVTVREIETGKCGQNELSREKVLKASDRLNSIPYHYRCVIGMSFEDILAMMRRWVTRTVGLDDNGKAKPCIIIYDYLKMLSSEDLSKNLQEYQMLGFISTALKNFMGRYGVGCLCFAQLNREGIDREDTGVISGSDRIIHYCTSFTIYKRKSDEERAEASNENVKFTHKLVPVISRHGEGLPDGDYINIQADYKHGRIIEGLTRNQLANGQTKNTNRGEALAIDENEANKLENNPIDLNPAA